MPQSMANFDAALKDNYGPGLRESVNNKNAVYSQLSVNDEDIQGRQAVWAVHTGRSNSTGARTELATLPTADRQRYSQVRDNLAFLYHTIKVSGPAQHLTKNDDGAFTRALEAELRGAEKDLANDVARQCFNQVIVISSTRYLGAIAKISNVSTDTLTLQAPDGTTISASEMRYFFVNESLDVINGTTAAVRGTASIASISAANSTITFGTGTTPAGTAANDYVARAGSFAAAETLGGELNGLRYLAHAADGTAAAVYANLDPASVPNWAAVQKGSSTTNIAEVQFDIAAEAIQTDGDGGEIDLWISEHSQRRKLAQQLQAQKRFSGNDVTLKAGWKGLQLTYGTLVVDRYCPVNTVFGLNTSEVARFMGMDFTWDEDDGRVLIRALDGSDAVEARYKSYQNIEMTNRNSHVLLTLATPVF